MKLAALACFAVLVSAGLARAQGSPGGSGRDPLPEQEVAPLLTTDPAGPGRDVIAPASSEPLAARTPRPWLYASDASAPAPGHAVATLGVGYASIDRGAARPFAADVAHAGGVFGAEAEIGLHRYVGLDLEGLLAGGALGTGPSAGAMLGASFFPLGGRGPVDLAVSGGYLHELGGDDGAWGRVAFAASFGRLRASATAVGEHVVDPARDPIDVMLTAGLSYSVTSWAGLGAEYAVQDLEEAADPDPRDGGMRHFVGPNARVLIANRVQLLGGPAFGLSPGSPAVLGRFAASGWF
jgi:hypothetical protein